jgi:hypothetical protein
MSWFKSSIDGMAREPPRSLRRAYFAMWEHDSRKLKKN